MKDKRLTQKLETEKDTNINYKRIENQRIIENLEKSIKFGWTSRKGAKQLTKEQIPVLMEYLVFKQSNLKIRSTISVNSSIRPLLNMAVAIPKPFSMYKSQDLKKYIADLLKEGKTKNTLNILGMLMRQFFVWYYNNNKKKQKEMTSWIKCKIKKKQLNPTELLTLEDVKKMVDIASTPRNKYIPIALFESGLRLSEFTNVRIGDCTLEGTGSNEVLYIDANGKTGKRRVFLKDTVPYFKALVEEHPHKNDKNSHLLVSSGDCREHRIKLSIIAVGYTIKKLAEKANIQKHVYPHLFRHSRASQLAGLGFTEMELRQIFGWEKDSDMPSTYVHLNNQTTTNKLKKLHNISTNTQNQVKKNLFSPLTCSCGRQNPLNTVYCLTCKKELNVKKQEVARDFFNYLLNSKEFGEKFRQLCIEGAEKYKEN